MPTPEAFALRFPELGIVPPERLDLLFAEAEATYAVSRFGGQADLAVMLYAAHEVAQADDEDDELAAIAAMQAQGVASYKSGDVSVTMREGGGSGGASSLDRLATTRYGQRLAEIIRAYVPRILVV